MIIGKAITAGGNGGNSYVLETIPERYKRVEYIEATGTQSINTGCSPTSNTKVVINLTPLASGMAENAVFGSTWAANGFFLMFYQNMLRWHSKGASVDVSTFNTSGENEIICTPTKITVNGTEYGLSGSQTDSTDPITLFYAGGYSAAKYGIYRLHSCKIYEGDSLIRNFIPVLDEKGVPCLYDKATKGYFYKQGNGEFAFEESPKPSLPEGGEIVCTLIVSTAEGALVKAKLESTEVSGTANEDGEIAFALGKEGLWTVSATLDGETKSTEILVEHNVEEELAFTKTFRIIHNNVQYDYKFLKNWTWADFIASEYNDGNFTIDGTNVRFLGCSVHIDRVLVTTSSALQEISYSVLPIMYVYEPGYTSFQNTDGYGAEGITASAQFSSSSVEVRGHYRENDYKYNITFTEARYKGYKKLFIKASAFTSSAYILWGGTEIKVSTMIEEFVTDISNSTGTCNITFRTYGETRFTVYDIHFE